MEPLASIGPWLTPRADPKTPLPLAVGTMNFGKRTSPEESEKIVRRAIERGLRFFDTANMYNEGESERILGRALGRERQDCFIATKVGAARIENRAEGLSAKAIAQAIDRSLERLGTDYVDLYYLHVPDPATPIEESVRAMKELVSAGKARAWGVSNYASWQVLEMMQLADAQGMPRPAVSQLLYNVLIRQLDVEYFRFAHRFPIHTTIYNPLAGGFLAGRHRKEHVPEGCRFDKNTLYMRRYWSDRFFELVTAVGEVAKEEGVTMVELAYGWVAGREGVDSVLVGPGDVGQLDAAIDGAAKRLSKGAQERLDALHLAFAGTDAKYAR